MRMVLLATVASCALLAAPVADAQEIVIGLGSTVTSVDPHFHNHTPNTNLSAHIFDTLVLQDEKQRLVPGLATEWRAIDDTTWEFKLRSGVKFHDGSEFGAEDVAASIRRVPNVPNSPSSFTSFVKSITETSVVDASTIRFKTAAPYPLLPNDLSAVYVISRKHETAPTGDFNAGSAAVGTGPFKFVQWTSGDRTVLERNDAWWGEKPHWAKATLKQITNDGARVAALLAGDVQVVDAVPTPDVARLRSNANIALAQTTSSRVIFLHIDSFRDQTPFATDKSGAPLAKNPLKDARVRTALSKAIDRQAIVDRLMEGVAVPAGGILTDGFFGSSPNLKAERYDLEGAKKLLTEAGYPSGFGVTAHGPNDRYVNDSKVLQAVGAMWTRAGVDTKVVTEPWAAFATAASAPRYSYSVVLVGWGTNTGEASSPLRALLATVDPATGMGPSNRGRYSNPQFDALLKQALATVDDAKREKLLQQATETAIGEHGLIPLHYQVAVWGLRKGLTYKARADEYTYAHEIRPAK
jgi:peptide/nickel transport system substrate-binding protein